MSKWVRELCPTPMCWLRRPSRHAVRAGIYSPAIEHRWRPVASPQLVSELTAVLNRHKSRRWLSRADARQFAADIAILAELVSDPPAAESPVTADPKDEYLVALTQVADVAALVSGDPHLTKLTDLQPPVLTPAAFLEQVQE